MEAKEIEVKNLVPNGSNPRRRLGDVAELAASIRSSGILQPLLVRKHGKQYEVIAGSRRLAAAKLVKLKAVPCVIVALEDDGAAAAALIENLQRESLPPIDEAEALARLAAGGMSLEALATQIGRSVSYVAGRRQLADLDRKVKDVAAKGELSLGVALQIARLPKAQHVEALEVVAGMTEDAARAAIERAFLLRLADAPFSRTDAALLPKAGPCTKCPKRTGAQPELFAADVKSKDVCTDRACYQLKLSKGWELEAERAKAAGVMVVEDKAAVRKIMGYGERPTAASGLVSADDYIDDQRTWREAVAASDLEIKPILIRSETGKAIEAYRRRDVASLAPKAPASTASDGEANEAASTKPDVSSRAAAKAARAATATLLGGIQKRCTADGVELAGWRTLLQVAIEELGYAALSDERIESLNEAADAGSLFALHAGLSEVVLAYAAERRKGEVHPQLERFAEIHGVVGGAGPVPPTPDHDFEGAGDAQGG